MVAVSHLSNVRHGAICHASGSRKNDGHDRRVSGYYRFRYIL
jgi:hypothetical protein